MEKRASGDKDSRRVEVRASGRAVRRDPELLVDGEPVAYGRLFDGTYFIPEHAYEWADDLETLGRNLVRYRERTQPRVPRLPRGDRRAYP
jgi:hypothetical protein